MWATLLVLAIAVSFEPFRIGITVMMLNRPRPTLQLVALLCGGFAMGLTVGLVVLFILHHTLPGGSSLTLPKVQTAIGVLALLVAVLLATNISARHFQRGPLASAAVGDDAGVVVVEPTPPNALEKLSARARHLLQGSSLWVAGVVGMGTALPSIDWQRPTGPARASRRCTTGSGLVVAGTLRGCWQRWAASCSRSRFRDCEATFAAAVQKPRSPAPKVKPPDRMDQPNQNPAPVAH